MGLIEKRQFLLGMDFDSEERLLQPGFSRKNLNVRVGSSISDGVGAAENVEGNTLIPNIELPEGDNKVIGAYWYKKKDLNYHFVWNENGDHGIYEYNHVSSKIVRVLQGSVFNFQKNSLITGINVVEFDDSSDLLYWVDKANPPRKINIQKAKSGGYSTPLTEEVIDAIKYPPLCPPTGVFETDVDQKVNYLNDQIWQFKAAYVYDDKEQSAWSPISVQIFPAVGCGSNSQGNTIKITIPKGGELVERVILAGRQGNLNDFQQLIDQEVDKYELDPDGNYVYTFRNNGTYNVVEINQSIKPYDRVPQIAGAQEFVKNKITYADVTEGYDNVEVDLDVEIDYEEVTEEDNRNTIKGYLRISNEANTNADYKPYQPIHNPGTGIVFGGFGSGNTDLDVGADFKQELPLGGFVIYLAGTDYYTASRQVNAGGEGEKIQETEFRVFNSSSKRNRKQIRSDMTGSSAGFYDDSRVWSTWEINNVPDGKYVLRVASNYTTSEDLKDPNRGYQKTSTYVQRIGYGATLGSTQTGAKELLVTVEGGEILEDIEIVISDLSAPGTSRDSAAVSGYLVNPSDPFYVPTSIEEALGQKRVEAANISWDNVTFGSAPGDNRFIDHNGFFYDRARDKYGIANIEVGLYKEDNIIGYDLNSGGSPTLLPDKFPVGGNTLGVFLIRNSDIFNYSKATAEFRFFDSDGSPIKNVRVISQLGDPGLSDSSGVATISLYASPGENRCSTRNFIFYLDEDDCSAEFDPAFVEEFFYIGKDYNNDLGDEIIIPDVLTTIKGNVTRVGLKKGGVYNFGIVYHDRGNRSGDVNFGKELVVPFYTEEVLGTLVEDSIQNFNWSIRSNPPEWATHYQIVRTKNTAVNQYIQWYTSEINYINSDGSSSNFSDGSLITLDITNLTDEYKTANPDSVLVYDYIAGDRIRFIKDSSDNYFEEYYDFKVLGFNAGVLTIEKSNTIPDISKGLLFEIYTPKLDVDQDIYYEIGECYEIGEATAPLGGTVKFHKGGTFDQNPFTGSPATGTLKGGDTYYRSRKVRDVSGLFKTDIDSQLFSDFWESKISDIGRPQRINKYAQRVTRPTTIYHSDDFVPETNINGLNSFFEEAFETYDRHYGTIKKLFEVNGRLDVYHELKVTKVYVQESVVFNQSGQGNIGIANEVLSYPSQPYAGEYGTMNPESFTENEGRRYFFDVRNGAVLRLSNDGMTPISDNKMHSYFESKSNFYSAFDQVPEIWGTYDENFDEYVINFGSISRPEGFSPDDLALVSSQAESVTEEIDGLEYTFFIGYSENEDGVPTEFEIVRNVADGTYDIVSRVGSVKLGRQELLTIPSETLGYSERTGHWTSFYDYTPECMSRVGIDFLTFKNGKAYLHNSNPSRNQFYGINFPSEVWAVFNQEPNVVKVYNALATESDTIWTVREMLTNKGQKSSLIEQDFQDDNGDGLVFDAKEGIHYAAILKDENTPNVDIPIIEGDDMRDASILIKFVNDSTEQERLFATHVNFSVSFRSNK